MIENQVGGTGTGAIAFGSFTFSSVSSHESQLVVPQVLIGSEGNRRWLTYLSFDTAKEVTVSAAMSALNAFLSNRPGDGLLTGATVVAGRMSENEYRSAVQTSVQRIADGQLKKIVLARDVLIELSSAIPTAQVLRRLARRYRHCWTYAVDGAIGSTPEMLVQVDGNVARARVLAGTLDRHNQQHLVESDKAYARRVLFGSEKQRYEHQLAVDSLTQSLSPYSKVMTSDCEPFVLELPNVWHLASDVTAQLNALNGPKPARVPSSLELVAALHPTAAVCGTPTEAADAAIHELEQMDRGAYAGPVGWTDGIGNGEWGIALRGGLIESPASVRLFAGCGIVQASTPEEELAESWSKLRPMLEALGVPHERQIIRRR
ncbi:isochorismate synthase MenF [Paenarthrobacter sp. A20]|uniref:isochorismate synthase n=1 Tax=Paenarthrobacter sp. A20 TaxID=2817891 RepID=UPI00209DCA6B|nr:isochorismate synthase [Paenarthrobacter sp. A20]MCP1415596.1 menaquinone-specific isochorismate synthase [Paenarthrobacter sp. A20]